jgi:hypothetical protein
VYHDLGVQHFDEGRRERLEHGLVRRLQDLATRSRSNPPSPLHPPPNRGAGGRFHSTYTNLVVAFTSPQSVQVRRSTRSTRSATHSA